MDIESAKRVRCSALRFREAIESLRDSGLDEFFTMFPRGTCGDTSELLGTWLSENGFGEFFYICGERGTFEDGGWFSHAWIEQDGWIVDITADQFPEVSDRIIVCHRAESVWHATFEVHRNRGSKALHRQLSGGDPGRLERLYRSIVNTAT